MGGEEKYKLIVSGRERGVLPALMRKALSGMSALYRAGVEGKNFMYSRGLLNSARLPVPVISVGNLTLGGTGKTPLVEYVARRFAAARRKAVILSRGYKSRCKGGNDEAALLAENLPDVPHVQARDRVLAGLRAVKTHRPDCVILDDGFQYRRLKRDLDIVVIDATNPFGHGRVLPRGLLREPLSALKRAGAIVISKINEASTEEVAEIRRALLEYVPGDRIFQAAHRPQGVYSLNDRKEVGTETLRGKRVFAFCGIGSPESFRRSLAALGCAVAGFHEFPDHHHYTEASLETIRKEAAAASAEIMITTQKDAVKLIGAETGGALHVLRIALEFVEGEDRFGALLDSVL